MHVACDPAVCLHSDWFHAETRLPDTYRTLTKSVALATAKRPSAGPIDPSITSAPITGVMPILRYRNLIIRCEAQAHLNTQSALGTVNTRWRPGSDGGASDEKNLMWPDLQPSHVSFFRALQPTVSYRSHLPPCQTTVSRSHLDAALPLGGTRSRSASSSCGTTLCTSDFSLDTIGKTANLRTRAAAVSATRSADASRLALNSARREHAIMRTQHSACQIKQFIDEMKQQN